MTAIFVSAVRMVGFLEIILSKKNAEAVEKSKQSTFEQKK